MYTSKQFSRQLKDNGCDLESERHYCGGHIWYHDIEEDFENEDGEFEECDNPDLLNEQDLYCHTAGLVCEYTIPAYDILNDICVKYAKEFFGEDEPDIKTLFYCSKHKNHDIELESGDDPKFCPQCGNKILKDKIQTTKNPTILIKAWDIINMLQQKKSQEEIEKYLWSVCKFNSKNK